MDASQDRVGQHKIREAYTQKWLMSGCERIFLFTHEKVAKLRTIIIAKAPYIV